MTNDWIDNRFTQIINPPSEFVIPKVKPAKEPKTAVETHSVIAEAKLRKF